MVERKKSDFFLNKKGQGLSTNAIILIILGIVILVVLILGFTIGWNKFLPFIQSGNNVQNIKTSCDTACATSSKFDFCETPRIVKDGVNDEFEATCDGLADAAYADRNYGIESCPAINCAA